MTICAVTHRPHTDETTCYVLLDELFCRACNSSLEITMPSIDTALIAHSIARIQARAMPPRIGGQVIREPQPTLMTASEHNQMDYLNHRAAAEPVEYASAERWMWALLIAVCVIEVAVFAWFSQY